MSVLWIMVCIGFSLHNLSLLSFKSNFVILFMEYSGYFIGVNIVVGKIKNRHGYWAGVKYDEPVGENDGFCDGHWAGAKYDEPVGENDGSCDGVRYFECLPNYGGFVRPTKVTVEHCFFKDLKEEL